MKINYNSDNNKNKIKNGNKDIADNTVAITIMLKVITIKVA